MLQKSIPNLRAILRRARHPNLPAVCEQRAVEALKHAAEARAQGFPGAARIYEAEAAEYRRIARTGGL